MLVRLCAAPFRSSGHPVFTPILFSSVFLFNLAASAIARPVFFPSRDIGNRPLF